MTQPFRALARRTWRAGAVTAVLLGALLYPGSGSGNGGLADFFAPPAGPADLAEIAAHFSIFVLFTYVWYRTLTNLAPALGVTVAIGIALAFGTEFAQLLVQRGVSVFDLAANLLGVIASAAFLHHRP